MKKLVMILAITSVIILASITTVAHSSLGSKLLMRSALHGNLVFSRILVIFGTDVCSVDSRGNTALRYALASDSPHTNMVDYLIKKGTLKKQLEQGSPYMCIRYAQSAVAYIDILAERGVDVNKWTSEHYTPLMEYANDGSLEAVEALIRHGANVNIVADDGRTALSEAVSQGNVGAVSLLIDKGADPAVKVDGASLLEIALRQRNNYKESPDAVLAYDRIINFLKDVNTTQKFNSKRQL